MDPIAAISGANATAATQPSSLGGLGSGAFLQLLVAQLRYQNPLSPTDGAEFMAQTAQFSTVETLQSISNTQQRLIGLQQVGIALDMVGHEVSAIDNTGATITGQVDGVRFGADGPILNVDGHDIYLDNIVNVVEQDPAT